jgi:acetylornithine/succinyldiaminopimelate/putrescine aminotransferase
MRTRQDVLNTPHTCTYTSCAGLFHHFKEPLMIVEGKMQYLFDERGRRFLDVRAVCARPWC